MKLHSILFYLPSLVVGLVVSTPDVEISYDGYKVIRFNTAGNAQNIRDKLASVSYNEWRSDHANYMDISLSPDQFTAFESLGLDYSVMHQDLGASITAESSLKLSWKESIADNLTWFNAYHPYADHEKYFRSLQVSFPNNSEIFSSGTSYQGRDIYGIHLWGAGGPGKPAVLWHGTVHAREWISSMVVEYLTMSLISGYPSDPFAKSVLDKYDFYIIPFVNPDGFVFTQKSNRLWRKNRQPPPSGSCIGRDINRQWPYQWDSNPDGASPDPCDETYRGVSPSDSPESRGLVAFVDKLRDSNSIKLYIDWHSYGQYILSPWGYTCNNYPADSSAHTALASKTANAIRTLQGTIFTYGPSCSTLYATTGDSVDYLHGPGASDWTFTIELRDTGNNGFVLPASQILSSGREQWEGMKVMLSSLD